MGYSKNMNFSSSHIPKGPIGQMTSLNAALKGIEGFAKLGSHLVDTGAMQKNIHATDYARVAALQAYFADVIDHHPHYKSLRRRGFLASRKVKSKFTREAAYEERESEPEGSLERDNRRQGQTTVQIAKKIIRHMEFREIS